MDFAPSRKTKKKEPGEITAFLVVSQFRTKVLYEAGCINPDLKAMINGPQIWMGFNPTKFKLSYYGLFLEG